MTDYAHAEAFCLMTYRADDGVTPFVITLKSGKTASHVNWAADVRRPDHVLAPGERYFGGPAQQPKLMIRL